MLNFDLSLMVVEPKGLLPIQKWDLTPDSIYVKMKKGSPHVSEENRFAEELGNLGEELENKVTFFRV
jgi:hypothetical protein